MKALVPMLLAVVLGGCAVVPGEGGKPGDRGRAPESDSERRLESDQALAPAAAELVADAEAASSAGEHERAAALLERAIRISPRNAVLWQNLAVVRYRQDRLAQAESLAEKSNALARDRELRRQNWSLIAECRRLRGDETGAAAARKQAAELGGQR